MTSLTSPKKKLSAYINSIQQDWSLNCSFLNNDNFSETMARHLDALHNITTRSNAGIK